VSDWQPYENCFIYSICVPNDLVWQPQRALRALEVLAGSLPQSIVQISASHEHIRWELIDIFGSPVPQVITTIQSVYPEAIIAVEPYVLAQWTPFYRQLTFFNSEQRVTVPLPYITDFRGYDPISTLVNTMSTLLPDERIVFSLYVGDPIPPQQLGVNGLLGMMMRKGHQWETQGIRQLYEEKMRSTNYATLIALQADSPVQGRVAILLHLVEALLVQQYQRVAPPNRLIRVDVFPVKHITSPQESLAANFIGFISKLINGQINERQHQAIGGVFNMLELAALWHLPHREMTSEKIVWTATGIVDIPKEIIGKQEGIALGTGTSQGQYYEVRIPDQDRETHLNIVGKSGVGKSTQLYHLIAQDIRRGAGVTVIDPHGTLVKDILQTAIPAEREQDVVVIDLANTDYPPPLNPLRGGLGNVRIGHILNVIQRLFPDTNQYARLSRYLRAALVGIGTDPQATIRDLGRVFTDDNYRGTLLPNIDNDDVLRTLEEYDELHGEQRQIREPILSRISPFIGNNMLVPSLCHPESLDFRSLIQQRKIILISLKMSDEEVSEQDRNLVGALLISRLQMSGMQDTSTPHYIYVDEVQQFVTTSLDEMFSEARKFGLSLTVAHQFLGQLPVKTLEAILGNVGATMMFQCSPSDAGAFGPYVRPQFSSDDLVNLNKFQSVVKMQYHGNTQPAFTLYGFEPIQKPADALEREQRIRGLSRNQYTPKSGQEVKEWHRSRYPRPSSIRTQGENNFYDTQN
jgi:hypothetical protein